MLDITLGGQTLDLMAERAIFWHATKTLIISDTHFGKGAIFRQQGIAIPEGHDRADLLRISQLIQQTQCQRLLILGDFIHGRLQPSHSFYSLFNTWRKEHAEVAVTLVLGNHDRQLEKHLLTQTKIYNTLTEQPFYFCHEPPEKPQETIYLAGHIHPYYRLKQGKEAYRLPTFWQKNSGMILPAFGSMTGGINLKRTQGERYFVIGGDLVFEAP